MNGKSPLTGQGRPSAAGAPGLPPRIPPRNAWLIFIAIVLGNYLLVRLLFPGAGEPMTVPYTVFKAEAGRRNVEVIYSRGTSIEGRFASPVTWPSAAQAQRPPASRAAKRRPPGAGKWPSRKPR